MMFEQKKLSDEETTALLKAIREEL
jgi:hypothetical protein